MGADVTGPFKRVTVAAMHSDSNPVGVGITVFLSQDAKHKLVYYDLT